MRVRLYPPSWQNHFYQALARGPVPGWLKSVLLFAGFVFLNHLVPWAEGKLSWWTFDASQLTFQIWFLVVFLAGGYFLRYADETLLRFRPIDDRPDRDYQDLTYRFTHLSRRTGWLITLAGLAFAVPSVSLGASYQQAGASLVALVATGAFMFSLVFFFFLFLMRALVMVRRLYREVGHINIFHLDPLHAFAGLTLRIGVFFVLVATLSYLTDVALAAEPSVGSFAFFMALNMVLAGAAFILPLGGIHERLRGEKERFGLENDRRLELAYRQLHERFDREDLGQMTEFRHAITAMLELRSEIRAVSTWPWEPGSLRSFLSALLLPIVLFLLQRLLSNLLAL